ncbi:alpha/beta hydrolase [Hymenobacter koreensis]|uniref:Alpha/beta hydrolase n=2 Tax=Hymenobacter koreensis TaxID=1084523 RepID=A0ABP8JNW1_9BACT
MARWAAPAAALCLLAACSGNSSNESADAAADQAANTDTRRTVKPSGPKPDWAPSIMPEMQAVIEQLTSMSGPTPLTKMTAQEARKAPSPTDAVMALMQKNNMPMPPSGLDTMSREVAPGVKARIYMPKSGNGPFPVVVYYHGGGWVIANLDTYDPSVRGLAEQTGAVFVSVAYRQAPENKFPTAHNDSFAAYQWVLKNAASIKGDPQRVAVAGESAGGNLACAVSMMARDKKVQMPKHQLLVYPIAGYNLNTPSYQKFAQAKPLNKDLMAWFFDKYLRSPADGKSPMIDLVNADLKGLPPTTIITAEIDPLMSEGKMLSDNLLKAGGSVRYQNYEGVTHEFFGMAAVVPQAKEAQELAANELQAALGK